MADPGFSPGGAPTPEVGVLTYFFGRKLHENERIWTPRGTRVPGVPLRSATEQSSILRFKLDVHIQSLLTSVADLGGRGTRVPLPIQFFSFSYSFCQKLCQIIGQTSPVGLVSPSGKFWINHCTSKCTCNGNITNILCMWVDLRSCGQDAKWDIGSWCSHLPLALVVTVLC